MLASDIKDICRFPTFASVFLSSVSSVPIFSSFSSLSIFLRALSGPKWFVVAIWPQRTAVRVSRKVTELKALKETVRYVYFLNLVCI